MADMKYLNFDLQIEHVGDKYHVRVLDSPAGQADCDFTLPFSDLELENFLLRIGRTRRSVRRIESPETEAARAFGGRLFNAVFSGEVRASLRSSQDEAERERAGLRIRLHLADVPELADLPWEYIYSVSLNRFLSLSVESPLVRYLELPERIRPLTVTPPLKVLAIISNPSDQEPLDVEREWANLKQALANLEQQGRLTLERLETATLAALQKQLRRGEWHILHFVGHGGFDEQAQDGVLIMEDERGRGRRVTGNDLGTILHDQRSLRLVILNACEGARSSRTDPFAGTAQSLVQQGIPAVIAMQFEITDEAAITFAQNFYEAIADSYPVDAALAEARKAIFASGNEIEWGTPVLYMRAPDGRIFDVGRLSTLESRSVPQVAAPSNEAPSKLTEQISAKPLQAEEVEKKAPASAPIAAPPRSVPVQSSAPARQFPMLALLLPVIALILIGGGIFLGGMLGQSNPTPTLHVALVPTASPQPTETTLPTSTPTLTPQPTSTVAPTSIVAAPTLTAPAGKLAVSVSLGDNTQFDSQLIWIINADGSGAKQVLRRGSQPALSPDGNKIAYYHWADGIYIANADGTNAPGTKLVSGTNMVGSISWSHNGQLIAYAITRPDGSDARINFAPLVGTGTLPPISGNSPSWSPDDKAIVFNSCAGSRCGIFKVNVAPGQNPVQLTTDNGSLPAWSPRGTKVVYQAPDNSGHIQLYIANADGSSEPKPLLAKSGSANHVNAAWSADGNLIFYRSDEGGSWGLWKIDAEGKNPPVKLSLNDPLGQLPLNDIRPAVSPHDSALSFANP